MRRIWRRPSRSFIPATAGSAQCRWRLRRDVRWSEFLAVIHRRYVLFVAVVHLRRAALHLWNHLLVRLRPARMRLVRIYVRIEPVFRRRRFVPEDIGLFGDELD